MNALEQDNHDPPGTFFTAPFLNKILILCVLIAACGCGQRQKNKEAHVGFPFVEILEDNGNELGFDEVMRKDSVDFEKHSTYLFVSPNTLWLKINFPEIVEKYYESHYLSLSYNSSEIELFYNKKKSGWVSLRSGLKVGDSEDTKERLIPTFDLKEIDPSKPILIKFTSYSLGRVFFLDKKGILDSMVGRTTFSSVLIGFLSLIFLVNIFRGIRSQNMLVVLYSMYVVFFIFSNLTEPFLPLLHHIFDIQPFLKFRLYLMSAIMASVFGMIYAIAFLKLRREDRVMFYVLLSIGTIDFFIKCFTVFKDQYAIYDLLINGYLITIELVIVVVAAVRSRLRGNKYVIYYLLAYVAFLVIFAYQTSLVQLDSELVYSQIIRFHLIGMVVEVLLLNIGLNERIVFERKQALSEKSEAQSDLLKFQTNQNVILEKKIQERTQELEEANISIRKTSEQLQASYEEQEKLLEFKQGMVQMIAHDMKNSLNSIIGFSASEAFNKKMQNINQNGNELLRMVTNLLDVQKFEEATINLNNAEWKVKDLILESSQQVELLMQMKSLKSDIKVPKKLVVKVDRNVIVRVIVNLLTNAIKFSKPGNKITIKVEVVENAEVHLCEIRVSDQGEGIAIEDMPHIFDKFWQGKAKYSGVAASTGLGLSFCKLAVESHQGTIAVESEIGKGSTFIVRLPLEGELSPTIIETEKFGYTDNRFILEKEREIIGKYVEAMIGLKVYEIGELNKILDNLENENVQSRWKTDLELAISAGDQNRYDELVKLVKDS